MAARFPGEEYLKARQYRASQESARNPLRSLGMGFVQGATEGVQTARKTAAEQLAEDRKFGADIALKLFDKYMPVRITNPKATDISQKYSPVPASEYPGIIQAVKNNGQPPSDIYLIDISDYRTSKAASATASTAGAEARLARLQTEAQRYETAYQNALNTYKSATDASITAKAEADMAIAKKQLEDVTAQMSQLNTQFYGAPPRQEYEYQPGTPEVPESGKWNPFKKDVEYALAVPGRVVPKGQAQAPAAQKGTPPPFNGVVKGQKASKNGVTFIWDGTKWQ